jgi:DNA mismatch repair protein MutS
MQSIDKLLQNFSPSEVLIKKTIKMISRKILVMITIVLFRRLDLQKDYAFEILTKHFQTVSLKGFGIADLKEGIIASGAILYYLSNNTIGVNILLTTIQPKMLMYGWIDLRFGILNCITVIIQMQSRYLM